MGSRKSSVLFCSDFPSIGCCDSCHDDYESGMDMCEYSPDTNYHGKESNALAIVCCKMKINDNRDSWAKILLEKRRKARASK